MKRGRVTALFLIAAAGGLPLTRNKKGKRLGDRERYFPIASYIM